MSKYQAYSEYKDTGIDWLPKVPTCWHVLPLKLVLMNKVKDGPHETPVFIEDGIPFLSVDGIQDGKLVFEGCRYISQEDHERYAKKCLPKYGDILLGKAASVGKVAFVDTEQEFNVWSPLAVLTPKSVKYGKFLYYNLQSTWLQAQCDVSSNSNTQKNLSMGVIDNLSFPIPVDSVAEKIASFLDHETAKIDTLIDKQQQLIQLLKEKRQAVISHAVTKGLNPNAPMRDSGVEWLGEVPEHWEMTRAKFVSNIFIPQRNKPELNDAEGTAWVTMENMKTSYIENTSLYVSRNASKVAGSKKLKKDSVIASCVGNFGVAAINKVDVIINQQLQAFIPFAIKAEYLRELVAMSTVYFELVGTAATLTYVNQEGFENLPVLVPPANEQKKICIYLEAENMKFENLIDKAQSAIQLMQERRSALISAAVTGKIDVRDWQVPAPMQNKEAV